MSDKEIRRKIERRLEEEKMMDKRILIGIIILLLAGFVILMMVAWNGGITRSDVRSYEKLLTTPLFNKDKRFRQLEALAAYMIREVIIVIDFFHTDSALKMEPPVTISKDLNSLINEILKSKEAKERDVLQAKNYALADFFEKVNRDLRVMLIYKSSSEKLTKSQWESFIEAELDIFNEKYREIIKAIDKLERKTRLPRELTIKTISSFSSKWTARSH